MPTTKRKHAKQKNPPESSSKSAFAITMEELQGITPSILAKWPVENFQSLSAGILVHLKREQLQVLNGQALSIIAQKLAQNIVPGTYQQLQVLASVLDIPNSSVIPGKKVLCNQIRESIQEQYSVSFSYTHIRGDHIKDYENLLQGESDEELEKLKKDYPSIVDPIKQDIMLNPILLSSNNSYEAETFITYSTGKTNLKDPVSNIAVDRYAIPNYSLRNMIRDLLLKSLGIAELSEPKSALKDLWKGNMVVDLERGQAIPGPIQFTVNNSSSSLQRRASQGRSTQQQQHVIALQERIQARRIQHTRYMQQEQQQALLLRRQGGNVENAIVIEENVS
jgi:hypothetical protein